MSGFQLKPKKAPSISEAHPALSRAPGPVLARAPAPGYYPGGPALRMGQASQPKVAIGSPGDAYEREADAAADRVAAGQKAGPISGLRPGALQRAVKAPDEEKPVQKKSAPEEEKPVQKKSAPEEEKPVQKKSAPEEEKPVQKKSAPEEEKPVQKKSAPEEEKPVQKKSAPEEEKPVQKKSAPEEEKPVQKKSAPDEEKPVQKKSAPDEEKPVQKKSAPEEEKPVQKKASLDEEKPLQSKGGAAHAPSMQNAAANAIAAKGPGAPLNQTSRAALEPAFGADLSHVRVHEETAARQAARDLNARAFTHGNDIWLGPGESQSDLRLMAHETAHTLQQGGVVRRAMAPEPTGYPKTEGDTLVFSQIAVPTWKHALHPAPVTRPRGYSSSQRVSGRAEGGHITLWQEMPGHLTRPKQILQDKINTLAEPDRPAIGEWKFLAPGNTIYGPGPADNITKELSRPQWDRNNRRDRFDVDHRTELQLGGANAPGNLWLVRGRINSDSGRNISDRVNEKVSEYVTRTKNGVPATETEIQGIKRNHALKFEQVVTNASCGYNDMPFTELDDAWTTAQISDGAHLGGVNPIPKTGPDTNVNEVTVYFGAESTLGIPVRLAGAASRRENSMVRPFEIASKSFPSLQPAQPGQPTAAPVAAGGTLGELSLRIPNGHPYLTKPNVSQAITPPLRVIARAGGRSGHIDAAQLRQLQIHYKHLSPMQITSLQSTDAGVHMTGRIMTTLPLLRSRPIEFEVNGDNISFGMTFAAGDLNVPRPFRIDEASLRLFASQRTFGAEGVLRFAVERLGQGRITAGADPEQGLVLSGRFDFDPGLFSESNVSVTYRNGQFSAAGHAAIDSSKVRGIRRADLDVTFENGVLQARGTIQPAIPGIQQGDVTVRYSESEGLTLGAGLQISRIPGIRSGRVDLTLRRNDQGYRLSASGSAEPAIPGINSQLSVSYDDGAFTVGGSVAYQRGMLSGTVTVGATNRPLDPQGTPIDGPPGQEMRLYGSGELSLRLAPWLQATARVRLLPNGEVVVTGRIGLPSSLDIFPQKAINKNIFTTPPLDIPIVGVAAAGRRIGIFATLSGGLDARASIGPGQLRELSLEVTYNPSREMDTTVRGRAQLHIPAYAGLRLFIRGGLGAGIPLVNAEAGLEVGGELGVEGAAQASVQVDWSPRQGLSLQALAEIYAQPKFKFDIAGYVRVNLDLLLTTIELYSKRWTFAQVEYGSNLRFGIRFPFRYQEGQPFDIRLSDVEFQTPDISVRDMISGLIDRIA